MEEYLKQQYNVYENRYLTNENEIVEHFEDNGSEFLECGQGYYQDETDLICKVGEKFYYVKIKATVLGNKQDVGDKLYFVDSIDSVEYEEIDKPLPKPKHQSKYVLELTMEQENALKNFLKNNYIEYSLIK